MHQLGSWRANVAYGQRVEIRTKDGTVPGVIARKVKDNEKVEWGQLYVDIGAADGAEARSLVAPGDPMVLVAPPLELAHGRVASRSLDNRAGVYVALETLRRAEGANVAVVAAAQEELGAHGAHGGRARAPAGRRDRDRRHLRDRRSGRRRQRPAATTRSAAAPAIFRGPAVNPRVFELLVEAAREEGIDHTIEAGAKTYTDADVTFASREGIPTGLVSIPLRNMHSPIEIVQLERPRGVHPAC